MSGTQKINFAQKSQNMANQHFYAAPRDFADALGSRNDVCVYVQIMDSPIIINWVSLLSFLGPSDVVLKFYSNFR